MKIHCLDIMKLVLKNLVYWVDHNFGEKYGTMGLRGLTYNLTSIYSVVTTKYFFNILISITYEHCFTCSM